MAVYRFGRGSVLARKTGGGGSGMGGYFAMGGREMRRGIAVAEAAAAAAVRCEEGVGSLFKGMRGLGWRGGGAK